MAIYDKHYYGCAEEVNMNAMDMLCPEFNHKEINNQPDNQVESTIEGLKKTDAGLKGIGKALSLTNKFRIGDNHKLYLRTTKGGIFHGNKHVSVTAFNKIGNKDLSVLGAKTQTASAKAGPVFDAINIGHGVVEDGGSFGYNAQKATVGAVAGAKGKKVGGKAGAIAGAKLGAKIGLIAGPKGVAVGAAIGGIVGGISGAIGGRSVVKKAAEAAYDGVRNVAEKTRDGVRKAGKAVRDSIGGLFR